MALGILLLYVFTLAPRHLDEWLNGAAGAPSSGVSSGTTSLHRDLWIADLHADSLLWSRDLLDEHRFGHVDVPRLRKGGVNLQTFSVVTKVPWGQNYHSNRGNSDKIFWLVMAQRWPPSTWFSLVERTLYQARRLHRAAARSDGTLRVITSRRDLRELKPGSKRVGGLLAIEGLHALEGEFDNLARFDRAGFRMMGIAHFFDNRVGGSAHGVEKIGLTEFGRRVVRNIEARNMIVDLAHASPRTIDDVLAVARRPVVVSHTGVRGTCEGPRNLTDEHLRGVARTGGLVGIGFWPGAVCGSTVDAIVRAVQYAVDEVGVDHVALGSDFDGTVTTPFTASGLARLTEKLREQNFRDSAVRKIMGGNVRRLLRRTLPGPPDARGRPPTEPGPTAGSRRQRADSTPARGKI